MSKKWRLYTKNIIALGNLVINNMYLHLQDQVQDTANQICGTLFVNLKCIAKVSGRCHMTVL